MARKAQPKRRIEIPEFESTYIPPFFDFCEVLKIPTGVIEWMGMLESITGSKLNVGRSTVAKLTSEGVSEGTFGKISTFMAPLTERVAFSRWLVRRTLQYSYLRSNYASWCGPIEGLKVSFKENPDLESPLMPMISFVEERGVAQLELLPKLRRLKKNTQTGHEVALAKRWIRLESEFLKRNTLIPSGVLDAGVKVIDLSVPPEELSGDQREVLSRHSLHIYWDFYLSALALFDAIGTHVHKGKSESVSTSVFHDVFRKLSKGDKSASRNAFEALMECWRDAYSIHTWTEFSKAIPIDNDTTEAGSTSDERKKHQLKEWRKGKSYPSEEMLKKFLERQPGKSPYQIKLMAFHGIIAIGLDKLIQLSIKGQKSDGIDKDECLNILEEIFSLYPQHCIKINNFTPYLDWQKVWQMAAV